MKRLYVVALAVWVAGFVAQGAEAASHTNAKFALHLTHPPAKNTTSFICQTESPNTLNISCSSYTVEGASGSAYSLYLVVAGVDPADTSDALSSGAQGLTLGIAYNGNTSQGIDVQSWTSCADLDFGNDWPNNGGGNVITWVACPQTPTVISPDGVHVVVGAFAIYAYGADTFQITPNFKALGVLKASDCTGGEWTINPANVARVSIDPTPTTPGCNPCVTPCPVPVLPVSWGKIKTLYNH